MKTKNKKLFYYPLWIISAIIILAGCSKETINEADLAAAEAQAETPGYQTKSSHSDQNKLIALIRRSTVKYQDIELALSDGYVFPPYCVPGMGYHLARPDLIENMIIDPEQPQVLLYEKMKNGKFKLVGVEFIVDIDDWDAENSEPPKLGNQSFDKLPQGPPFPSYQLHVWVWKHNPNGMYFPVNPNVSCPD
jgi:hypothetical protein